MQNLLNLLVDFFVTKETVFSRFFTAMEKLYIFHLKDVRSSRDQAKLIDAIIETWVSFVDLFLVLSFTPGPIEVY